MIPQLENYLIALIEAYPSYPQLLSYRDSDFPGEGILSPLWHNDYTGARIENHLLHGKTCVSKIRN